MALKTASEGKVLYRPSSIGPTGLGDEYCEWCGRDIHRPASPCSTASAETRALMVDDPRSGARCRWELRVRHIPV